jgi:hypothetical protein
VQCALFCKIHVTWPGFWQCQLRAELSARSTSSGWFPPFLEPLNRSEAENLLLGTVLLNSCTTNATWPEPIVLVILKSTFKITHFYLAASRSLRSEEPEVGGVNKVLVAFAKARVAYWPPHLNQLYLYCC